ncbi:MAG: hypothetical protein GX584_11575 [Clostridiaceae bacterium]|nr:hypothetical protein [Clostridiaceae bacterium]
MTDNGLQHFVSKNTPFWGYCSIFVFPIFVTESKVFHNEQMKHKRFIAILFILAQMGVYGQGNPRETVTVGDDIFLPVSQDEYLTALISAEAKKEKEHPQTVTVDDNLIEMDRFRKDASQSPETEQVASAYKKELARLSPAQRGSPRLYEPRHTVGFSLTDDRIYEMYNNQNLWKHIIDEVH